VPVTDDPPPAINDQFAGPADPIAAVPANAQALAPSPVFGIPGGPLAPGARGPADTDVLEQAHEVADPDDVTVDIELVLAEFIGEGPDD